MDNGEVIPGLNEDWTLMGAKAMEWGAGVVSAMMFSELFIHGSKMGKGMPLLVIITVCTTYSLAALRKRFPDEERGVRNLAMASCGIPPVGIPAPACIQPMWSGAPVRELSPEREFVKLGLEEVVGMPDPTEEGPTTGGSK